MTLTGLLPVRLGVFARTPRTRHRAIDEVERQKALRIGADLRIKALSVQLDDQAREHADTVAGLERQVADLERRLGIACQASAAADQTQEIDPEVVKRLIEPVPLSRAPFATTDPGRVRPAWARTP